MNVAHRRMSCHMHVLQCAARRGIVMTADDIVRLEDLIGRSAPAFERPGAARYLLTVKPAGGRRMRAVYDTGLRCLVSIWHARGRRQ